MKKRILALGLTLAATLAWTLPALALEGGETEVAVTLNGFDLGLEHPALARDGVTLVPAEEFCAAFGTGCRWTWDGARSCLILPDRLLVPGEEGVQFRDGVLYAPVRTLAKEAGVEVSWDGAVRLQTAKTRVEVDSLADFFNAVAPDTEIVLAPGRYSFADLDPTGLQNNYVRVESGVDTRVEGSAAEAYDLVISGVRNLTVTAPGVTFATPWAYADVLKFESCEGLALNGFTLVHDVEPGYCVGDCLELSVCRDVRVSDCTLDGSGAYGLRAEYSDNIYVENSRIQNCTYGAASLLGCKNVNISGTDVENCLDCFHLVEVSACDGVRVENGRISNSSALALVQCVEDSWGVLFRNCVFEDSRFDVKSDAGYAASGGAAFVDCEFS